MKKNIIKRVSSIVLITVLLLSFAACGSSSSGTPANTPENAKPQEQAAPKAEESPKEPAQETKSKPTIKIGAKDFTEGLVLSEIYALALEANGYKVERKFNIASSVIHDALKNKEIDLYPEYTGTSLLSILKLPLVTDPQKVYDTVKEEYKTKFDLVWLDYSAANDSQGLVITKAASDKYGIKTISDLQKNADKIRFASQGEFEQREDGLPALTKVYGEFKFKSIQVFDNSLKYQVLSNDKADLAVAYTTEGALADPKYVVLEDDKKVWPPYNVGPVVRQEILTASPEIAEILNKVSAKIDTKGITSLNAEVDVKKREFEEVAKEFYDSIK